MSTIEQARKIDKEILAWVGVGSEQRAHSVIEWCLRESIDVRMSALQLALAMKHQPYWTQGPSNYLDMVQSFTAAIRIKT